jgi:hypothetical protein
MSRPTLRLACALVVLLAGCAGGGAGASVPPATPGEPTAAALTEEEAVSLVLAENDRFTGLEPRDPDQIGQGSFYEVTPGDDGGYRVDVEVGWGDCPAGCIYSHRWAYEVHPDRRVELVDESGDPLEEQNGSGVDDY